MQSFKHFDVISVIDKSIDHGKLLWIVFHNNVDSFDVNFCWGFSENSAHKLLHYNVIPMVSTKLSTMAVNQLARQKSLGYCKNVFFFLNGVQTFRCQSALTDYYFLKMISPFTLILYHISCY